MIIQTGMRTDIPAFYSTWFINRVKEGFVYVRNPYNEHQVSAYQLDPNVVDALGFCTKNPAPMLKHMNELSDYSQYWHVSITPYGKEIEPNVPPVKDVIKSFQTLSKMVGANAVAWRYDPIFINDAYSLSYHKRAFERMAYLLHGYTHTVVISFIDLYAKTKRNFPEVKEVNYSQRLELGEFICAVAKKYDMEVRPCAEGKELEMFGANCSGCITQELFEKAIEKELIIPNFVPQRKECGCVFGKDIGQYNTCGHFCRYCYANEDKQLVVKNRSKHDPNSPFLIGHSHPDDQIHWVEQKSWVNRQVRLF